MQILCYHPMTEEEKLAEVEVIKLVFAYYGLVVSSQYDNMMEFKVTNRNQMKRPAALASSKK